MTKIYTSTINDYHDWDRLDITAKAKNIFSPPFDLVKRHKSGEIDDAQYILEYTTQMRHSYKYERHIWEAHLEFRRITLVCHCPPDKFCHRFVLADILKKCGATYEGEIDAT